jgi:hypothetical protein
MVDNYDPLTALENARHWVRHWQRDRESNLMPTQESLVKAEIALSVAIELLKKGARP